MAIDIVIAFLAIHTDGVQKWPFGAASVEALCQRLFPTTWARAQVIAAAMAARRAGRQAACRRPEHALQATHRCGCGHARHHAGADVALRLAAIEAAFREEAAARGLKVDAAFFAGPPSEAALARWGFDRFETGGRQLRSAAPGAAELLRVCRGSGAAFAAAEAWLLAKGAIAPRGVDPVDVAPARVGADGTRVWSA